MRVRMTGAGREYVWGRIGTMTSVYRLSASLESCSGVVQRLQPIRSSVSSKAQMPSGGRTESVWKRDIQLGCKALRLKAKDAGQIDYCQLGKLAVVKASLADFQSEPRPASADSSISTAACRWWRAATVSRARFE